MMTRPQEAVPTSLLPPREHPGLSSLSLQIAEPPPICTRFGVERTPSCPYKSRSPGRIRILHLRCLLRDFGSRRESKDAAEAIVATGHLSVIRNLLTSSVLTWGDRSHRGRLLLLHQPEHAAELRFAEAVVRLFEPRDAAKPSPSVINT